MTRLIVWRHGNTDWNAGERVQGQADTTLNGYGQAQAAAAAVLLAALGPDTIVASDLRRAAETATALGTRTGLPVQLDGRLRERHFGAWQGLTIAEIAQRYPVEYDRWRAGAATLGHGVEDVADVAKRVGAALREAVRATPGGTVVIATHGGAARYGMGDLLGWSPEVIRSVGGLGNGRWAELWLDAAKGWVLRAYNVGVDAATRPSRHPGAEPGGEV